jgi:hypothetical protein
MIIPSDWFCLEKPTLVRYLLLINAVPLTRMNQSLCLLPSHTHHLLRSCQVAIVGNSTREHENTRQHKIKSVRCSVRAKITRAMTAKTKFTH